MKAVLVSKVRINYDDHDEFFVQVGGHQNSILSPLLFNMVLQTITGIQNWHLLGLLYADDLALIEDSILGLEKQFQVWKQNLEIEEP